MARIRSAAELDVAPRQQASTLQGIRTTALEQVRRFCERQGVDWKQCVNWNRFNQIVFANITPNRRGLDQRSFQRELESHESQSTAAQPTAKGTAETAEAPQRTVRRPARRAAEREQAATAQRRVQSQMSAQTWANAYSQTEDALDGHPKLTEDDRTAIHNIVDQSAPGNRRLVEMNLRSYLRLLSTDRHQISAGEADRLFSEVMAVSEGAEAAVLAERRGSTVRAVPPVQRLAAAGLQRRDEEAPAREERYVYRFTVMDARGANRANPKVMSTFEIVSPEQIADAAHLSNFLGNPPAGTTISRVTNSGGRIRIDNQPQEMARLRSGVHTIINTPGLRIELAEQQQGAGQRG